MLGLALLDAPAAAETTCRPSEAPTSMVAIVDRIIADGVRFVFVGERHDAAPPKRVAVEVANRLLDRGVDAGLYVEGFRDGCEPLSRECRSLARLFGMPAYAELLRDSRAPVWPLDPQRRRRRVASMAARIASGREVVRVVLAGNSHVLYAGVPRAELRIFGGGMRYPDPGDLVESFPPELTLTLALARAPAGTRQWRRDGCRADYVLTGAAAEAPERAAP